MAAKPLIIVGKTALLAAIYNEDFLPTAIVRPEDAPNAPMCLHSLRFGDLDTVEHLIEAAKAGDEKADVEQLKFELYKFYEHYPSKTHVCVGCSVNSTKDSEVVQHYIKDSEATAKKLCEDCP